MEAHILLRFRERAKNKEAFDLIVSKVKLQLVINFNFNCDNWTVQNTNKNYSYDEYEFDYSSGATLVVSVNEANIGEIEILNLISGKEFKRSFNSLQELEILF
jgi:hypothetical protein